MIFLIFNPINSDFMLSKMDEKFRIQLGKPAIEISGLKIWVHGRQFPDMEDYWDGNWLRITAHCGAQGSSVWASGPIIHLSELHEWLISARKLNETLKGEANLECMEPELSVCIQSGSLGQMEMEVNITPDHLKQEHRFRFEIDQSYLPQLISQCSRVLELNHIRGECE